MTIKLSCTDAELTAAVALRVAGWSWVDAEAGVGKKPRPSDGEFSLYPLPLFAVDANAVIPLLEKHPSIAIDFSRYLVPTLAWKVAVSISGSSFALDYGTTFARAACFALLRAAGVEITP